MPLGSPRASPSPTRPTPTTSPRRCAARSPSATARRSSTRAASPCARDPRPEDAGLGTQGPGGRPRALLRPVPRLARGAGQVDLVGRDWAALAVAERSPVSRRAALAPRRGAEHHEWVRADRPAAAPRSLGHVSKRRETGTIPAEGTRWTGRSPARRPERRRRGLCRGHRHQPQPVPACASGPSVSGAIVAMDSLYGPRARHGGRLLLTTTRASSTAPPRRCASRAPRSSRFVYSAALDNGYTPSSIVQDSPIYHRGGSRPEAWSPSNYDGKSGGARTPCATASSIRRT